MRQMFHVGPMRRGVDDQGGAERREEDRGHAEEADVEGSDPEVEQVAAQQGAAPYPVLSLDSSEET